MYYHLWAALGFAILYAETGWAHSQSVERALLIGGLAFIAFLISFYASRRIAHYTLNDVAPVVQTQVLCGATTGALIILGLNAIVWVVLAGDVPLLEELYAYTLVAIFLFHGFAGAIASHIVYLQQTRQYNSNQLVAVIILVTLVLLVLVLYWFALDWAIPREAYIHVRDLTLVSLILLSYGRAVYLMAHH
jgi:hypothetical protein